MLNLTTYIYLFISYLYRIIESCQILPALNAIFTDTCATQTLYNSFFLTAGHPTTQIGIIVTVTRGSAEKNTENEKWVKTQK